MTTMVDEIWDRQYRSSRDQLHAGIDQLVGKLRKGIAATFKALHDVQFAAPWKTRSRDVGCA